MHTNCIKLTEVALAKSTQLLLDKEARILELTEENFQLTETIKNLHSDCDIYARIKEKMEVESAHNLF